MLIDNIGYYHNQSLKLTESYRQVHKTSYNLDEFVTVVINDLSAAYPTIFDKDALTAAYPDIKKASGPIFLNITSYDGSASSYNSLMTSNFQYLADNKSISQTTANSLIDIFVNDGSYDKLNTDLTALYKNTTNTNDKNYIYAGLQTLNSSYTYWQNYAAINNGGTVPTGAGMWQIYAWDAAGAIAGLYGGPVWSIIQGGIVSGCMDPMYRPYPLPGKL